MCRNFKPPSGRHEQRIVPSAGNVPQIAILYYVSARAPPTALRGTQVMRPDGRGPGGVWCRDISSQYVDRAGSKMILVVRGTFQCPTQNLGAEDAQFGRVGKCRHWRAGAVLRTFGGPRRVRFSQRVEP
jgi:hypothetical protein